MKPITKRVFSGLLLITLTGLGYEVATHESNSSFRAAVENKVKNVEFTNTAYAQSFDRGYADLVKRVIPGVVNISTFARPKMQPGYGYRNGGQNELFQRFYEEFFGGRLPPQQQGPRGGQGDGGEDDDQTPKVDPRGKSVPVALGTGFIIDAAEGLILTNNHVVQGAEEVKIQFREEETELVPAEIIGRDPELDVALLKVKIKTKLVAIPMGDSDAIDVGEYVLAIGNPLGYGHTVSHGILSAKGRRNPEFRMGRFLQTDASINPGNSGGPLINVKGEVIGINNAIDARAQGIGFAIPINLVKGVLTQLKTKGSVSRGYLGVSAADLTPEIAEQLHMNTALRGVIVSDVQPGQAADKGGVKPYDVITAVNGEAITNSSDLTMKVSSIPVGQSAKVEIVRSGKPRTLDIKISARPIPGMEPKEDLHANRQSRPKGVAFDDYGFNVQAIIYQGAGKVFIDTVIPGSPAANSGLSRGDQILDVSGKEIHTAADLQKAMKSVKGNSVMVRVKRVDQSGNEFVSVVVLSK